MTLSAQHIQDTPALYHRFCLLFLETALLDTMDLQTTLATLTVRHVFTIRPADLIICFNLLLGVTSSDSEVKLGFTSRPQLRVLHCCRPDTASVNFRTAPLNPRLQIGGPRAGCAWGTLTKPECPSDGPLPMLYHNPLAVLSPALLI